MSQSPVATHALETQGSSIWQTDSLVSPSLELFSPGDWGWAFKEVEWQPFWTTLPDVTKSCRELIRCWCKVECRGSYSCTKSPLQCTELCSCLVTNATRSNLIPRQVPWFKLAEEIRRGVNCVKCTTINLLFPASDRLMIRVLCRKSF